MSLKFVKSHIDIDLGIGEHVQDMQNSFYGNIHHVDPRRRVEYQESKLINEDNHAVANLPQQGYQVEFNYDYKPGYLKQ